MACNISQFCWKLERPHPHRLRLVLFCAPGLAKQLKRALPAGWGFRSRRSSSLETASPGAMVQFLGPLEGDPDLTKLLEEYEERSKEIARGRKLAPDRYQRLKQVVGAILCWAELGGRCRPRLDRSKLEVL